MINKKIYTPSIGDLLNKNKGILNYIYDPCGNKIGVVVAKKGLNRNNPQIGWALFCEVNYYNIHIDAFSKFKEGKYIINNHITKNSAIQKIYNNLLSDILKNINDLKISYDIYRPQNKADVVALAFTRLNTNRDRFFVSDSEQGNQSKTDLMKNIIQKSDNGIDMDATESNYIRKAVRAMEYRAWKYFKD